MIDDLTHTNEHLTNREVTLVRAFIIMNYGSSYDRCQVLVELLSIKERRDDLSIR